MPRAQGRAARAARLSGWLRREVRLWQLALAVLAGNLLVHQLPALPAGGVLLLATLAALAWIARLGCVLAVLPAVAAIAFCYTAAVAADSLGRRWPAASDGTDVELSGWIDGFPTRDAGRTVFSFRVASAAAQPAPRRVRLSWYAPVPELVPGQSLALTARLRSPRGLVNPRGFDYERWLFVEGYDATGYVRAGERVDRSYGAAQAWLRLRAALVGRLAAAIDDADAAALVTALGLGERQAFTDRHWTVLQRTGTSHLVAVSGLHIGLIAALAFFSLRWLALRLPAGLARQAPTLAAAACIGPAALYAALAGFALPTRRALLMLLVAQGLVIARRRWPLASGLGLALLLVLAFDPVASLSASFWLSFGAVALLLGAAATGRPAGTAGGAGAAAGLHRLAEFGRLQWVLSLGLAPFVLWYFEQVSLASFVVNLIAIPVFSLLVVPLSLLATALAGFGQGDSLPVALAAGVASRVWQGLELAAAHPLAAFALPRPPLAALWIALAAIAMAMPRHGLPARHLALLGLLPLTVPSGSRPEPGELAVTVLDVGHGLAVILETRSYRALYDAGPLYRSGFDAGAEIVGPVLAAGGRRGLDLVLVGHGDSDHAGGMQAVLDRYPDARLIAGPDIEHPAAAVCRAGQRWIRDGVEFSVLHPPAGFTPEGNESSCVLHVAAPGGSLLLTGDIERRGEARLVRVGGIAADVAVIPHHGSATSSSSAFVAATAPRLAIASAGHNNRWNFPRPEVRERWEAAGARLIVTGDSGAVSIRFTAAGIHYRAASRDHRRYWQAERDAVSGLIDPSAL